MYQNQTETGFNSNARPYDSSNVSTNWFKCISIKDFKQQKNEKDPSLYKKIMNQITMNSAHNCGDGYYFHSKKYF